SALTSRRPRRYLRQSPDRDGKGEHPHRYSVHGSHLLGQCHGRLQATSPTRYRPTLFPPRDHDSRQALVAARVLAYEQQSRRPGSGLRMVTPWTCRQGSTLLLMGSAVWLPSATGLIGVALGGLVSLAVSRQQIREARALRADEAVQERYRRSVDRRFKAFSEFIIQHRAARGALLFYYSQLDGKPSLSDINKALRSA